MTKCIDMVLLGIVDGKLVPKLSQVGGSYAYRTFDTASFDYSKIVLCILREVVYPLNIYKFIFIPSQLNLRIL